MLQVPASRDRVRVPSLLTAAVTDRGPAIRSSASMTGASPLRMAIWVAPGAQSHEMEASEECSARRPAVAPEQTSPPAFASTRRVLGPDGKVKYVRYSKCKIKDVVDAPEGTIDPYLRVLSFWNEDRPLVAITPHACSKK